MDGAIVSERILSKEERMPSTSSLWRHWLRTAYIHTLWHNSNDYDVYSNLPIPENNGWIKNKNDEYEIDWEDPTKKSKIKSNMDFLLSGCKCKTGCKTRKCGCKKAGKVCGPGCVCSGCGNFQTDQPMEDNMQEDSDESDCTTESGEENVETEVISDFMPFSFIDL